jgi:branched-chain amino acid transport system ATP-binding protein
MLLQVENLSSGYGRVAVLHGVDVQVAEGEIVSVVGANGAGKTTLLRAISGVQPISQGRILFAGKDITGLSAAERVRLGIVQVPEGRQIFSPLSVEANLRLGGYTRPSVDVDEAVQEVFDLFPVLRERREGIAGMLSGGEQQMLAIGRALIARPKLLILDEPSLGLAPLMVSFIFERISELNAENITILLVEQNAGIALGIAESAYLLETGRIVAHGTGMALRFDPKVQSAYLGI